MHPQNLDPHGPDTITAVTRRQPMTHHRPAPPTLRKLLDEARATGNWDSVADWCEFFDWAEAVGMPAVELYLECAASQPVNRPQLIEAVSAARAAGTPWPRIAEILIANPQAAQDHYSPLIETAKPAHR